MAEKIDGWAGCKTLAEIVIFLIEEKKTESKEFKALLEFYGREKLTRIWLEHKKKEQVKK